MTPIIIILGIISLFSMAVVLLKVVNNNEHNWDRRATNSPSNHEFNSFMKRVKLTSSRMK